jgi:hypothetical protein
VPEVPSAEWHKVTSTVDVEIRLCARCPKEAKLQAVRDLHAALEAGWLGFEIGERIPLADIARAHELVEPDAARGVVVVI